MTLVHFSPDEKPALVKTIAVLTLVNGIVNIFWGLAATATVVSSLVLACLAGFTLLPTILGVFEILFAARLLADPMQPTRPSQSIAILEILCVLIGNVFSMIVGILALVFYNDPQVKEFFVRLNAGTPAPPAPPVPQPDPQSPPAAPAVPERKKPAPRKVASSKAGKPAADQRPGPAGKKGSSSS